MYLVDPSLWSSLSIESTFGRHLLCTAMTRQGVLFLWPVRLPGTDGKIDHWGSSTLEAIDTARRQWVRVVPNLDLGAYDVLEAVGDLPDPEWPAHSFGDLLRVAFRGKMIDRMDHPVLRKLRGEV